MARYTRRNGNSELSIESQAKQLIDDVNKLLKGFPENTDCMDFMIDVAGILLNIKQFLNDKADKEWERPSEFQELSSKFSEALAEGNIPPYLAEVAHKHKFDAMDMRIILTLSAVSLGLGQNINEIQELQDFLSATNQECLDLAKRLLFEGRLVGSHVVIIESYNHSFKDSNIYISESFIKPFLRGEGRFSNGWEVASQEELLDKLPLIRNCFAEGVNCLHEPTSSEFTVSKETRNLERAVNTFEASLKPDWPLSKIFANGFGCAYVLQYITS